MRYVLSLTGLLVACAQRASTPASARTDAAASASQAISPPPTPTNPVPPAEQTQPAAAPTPCTVSAIAEPGRKGAQIRKGPGTEHAVLVALRYDKDQTIEVAVSGVMGKWFRITRATGTPNGKTYFKGEGWLPTSFFVTSTKVDDDDDWVALRKEPGAAAPETGRITGYDQVLKVESCRDGWVLVSHKGQHGWLAREDQLATTPM